MTVNTRIYHRFTGYTLKDCDCRYCLYYGGKRKGKTQCRARQCVCKDEIRTAIRREKRGAISKEPERNPTIIGSSADFTRKG